MVLAGFLVIIPPALIAEYRNRLINIHPSLIPSFCGTGYYGLKVHEAVLARGNKVTGATVHFVDEGTDMVMFNPELTKCSEPYETEEGCLSLSGTRPTTRYRKITVRYQNAAFQTRQRTFRDWTAQIIQHEIDHCNGILI